MGSASFNTRLFYLGYQISSSTTIFVGVMASQTLLMGQLSLFKVLSSQVVQQMCPDSEELTESRWQHLGDIRDQMSRPSAETSIPIKSRYLILILAQNSSNNNRRFWFLFWSNYCSHGFSRLSSFKSGNGFLFYKENIPPFKWIYKGREGMRGRTKRGNWIQESVQEKRNWEKEHNRVHSSNFLCHLLCFFSPNNLGGLKIVTPFKMEI